MTSSAIIPIQKLVGALLDGDTPFPPKYLYRLSDISSEDLAELEKSWPQVPAWRRKAIMEDIDELGESNYTLSFESFARLGLRDSDPSVRELAVRSLWEYESNDLVHVYLDLIEKDADPNVRAVAASGLGKYIFFGELEELSPHWLRKIEERLLAVVSGKEAALVRRRALESLGYSGREEVTPLIETAYQSANNDWIASALFAMGRSANREWEPKVMASLQHDLPQVCSEAARAAGELELSGALPRLLELLQDEDTDVRMAAVWALSEIGGEGVEEALEDLLEETDDDEESSIIEAALDNLEFNQDVGMFSLLDVPLTGEDADGGPYVDFSADELDEDSLDDGDGYAGDDEDEVM